jgi:hypothetical protein
MSKCREIRGHGPVRLAAAAVALAALLAGATSYASPDTPFARITAWQMGKLGGTPFSTHPIQKKGERFFLVRHLKQGESFAGVVKSYCGIAGITPEECKQVAVAAEEFHVQDHWHKNWQGNDTILLLVPEAVYQAGSQEPSK